MFNLNLTHCSFPVMQSTTDKRNKHFLSCCMVEDHRNPFLFTLLSFPLEKNKFKLILINPVLSSKAHSGFCCFLLVLLLPDGWCPKPEATHQLQPCRCWAEQKDCFTLFQTIFLLIQKFHLQMTLHKCVMLLTHIPACDRITHGSFSVKLWVTFFSPNLVPATLVVAVTCGILCFQGTCIIFLAMGFTAEQIMWVFLFLYWISFYFPPRLLLQFVKIILNYNPVFQNVWSPSQPGGCQHSLQTMTPGDFWTQLLNVVLFAELHHLWVGFGKYFHLAWIKRL